MERQPNKRSLVRIKRRQAAKKQNMNTPEVSKTCTRKFSRITRRKLNEGKKNGSLPQDRGKECQTLKIGSMNVEGLSYQSSIAVQDLISTEKHDVIMFSCELKYKYEGR